MALEEQGAPAAVPQADEFRLSHSLFRRPDKFRIGEDFGLFVKKLNLYFEAGELNDVKKRQLALLFKLHCKGSYRESRRPRIRRCR